MAGSQKRRLVAENQSNNEVQQTEVQADFEGRNPEYEDFHGIKQLLKQLFLKAHIDVGKLTELIINQQGLGSVLKQSFDDYDEEDEDEDLVDASEVFGVSTIVNLSAKKDLPVVQELLNYIKEMANQHFKNEKTELEDIVSGSANIGLLLNERFINIPAKVADPLLSSLEKELESISKKDTSYKFDYIIMFCKTYRNQKNGEEFFSNPEESVFCKQSDINFEFSVANQTDTGLSGKWTEEDAEMTPYRRIIIFKCSKLSQIINSVREFVA